MIKTLTAIKARQNLGELLEEVYYNGDQFIIERAGKPMAAVVPLWQLEARKKHHDRLSGILDKLWESAPKAKSAAAEREVADAIRTVRAKIIRKKT
jgi:prevent-host-death family protein